MGVNPAELHKRRKEREQDQPEASQKGMPASPAAVEAERRSIGKKSTAAVTQAEYRNNGPIKSSTAEIRTPDGQQIAASKRFAIGPVELSQTITGPGFSEFQIFGVPVYKRGHINPQANFVHQQVNKNIRFAAQPSAKDANVERGSANHSAEARQNPSTDAIAKNRAALIASTGKRNPDNQDVYNALRRHYGNDKAAYSFAQRDFGINAGALVKDQSTRNASFGQVAGQAAGKATEAAPPRAIPVQPPAQERIPKAVPVPPQTQQSIPKAVPVQDPQHSTARQVVKDYFKLAGVPASEYGSNKGFDKAQEHASKMGPEHRKAFDAAIAARRAEIREASKHN